MCKVTSSIVSKRDRRAKARARARHETINRRFKKFSVLSKRFRRDRSKHQICFLLLQLSSRLVLTLVISPTP